jgi:ribA/ribD-fused uncharacterized protein
MVLPADRKTLIAEWVMGTQHPFTFFWGHTPPDGQSGPGPWVLSQWYPAVTVVDRIEYPTAEHYMMTEKAKLFRDKKALAKIASSDDPAVAKHAGREVRGYVDAVWASMRFSIVCEGCYGKFSNDAALGEYLMGTKGSVLVEASPQDTVWGIGLAADDADAGDPTKWKGDNLLGFALMDARLRLLREAHAKNQK